METRRRLEQKQEEDQDKKITRTGEEEGRLRQEVKNKSKKETRKIRGYHGLGWGLEDQDKDNKKIRTEA
jgi:hypothetical protein